MKVNKAGGNLTVSCSDNTWMRILIWIFLDVGDGTFSGQIIHVIHLPIKKYKLINNFHNKFIQAIIYKA
jgi:hypothetical protein